MPKVSESRSCSVKNEDFSIFILHEFFYSPVVQIENNDCGSGQAIRYAAQEVMIHEDALLHDGDQMLNPGI